MTCSVRNLARLRREVGAAVLGGHLAAAENPLLAVSYNFLAGWYNAKEREICDNIRRQVWINLGDWR